MFMTTSQLVSMPERKGFEVDGTWKIPSSKETSSQANLWLFPKTKVVFSKLGIHSFRWKNKEFENLQKPHIFCLPLSFSSSLPLPPPSIMSFFPSFPFFSFSFSFIFFFFFLLLQEQYSTCAYIHAQMHSFMRLALYFPVFTLTPESVHLSALKQLKTRSLPHDTKV